MTDAQKNEHVDTGALVLFYAGKAARHHDAMQSENAALRSVYAQAQNAGLDLEAFKAARKITGAKRKSADIIASIKSLGRTYEYALVLNRPTVSQINIEDYISDQDAPKGRDQEIFQEGRMAALTGSADQPPVGYGEADQNHWVEGWEDGERLRKLAQEMEENLTAAEEEAEDIDDEDLDDEDLDDEVEAQTDQTDADPEPIDDPVMDNVAEFKRDVEAEAAGDELPDIPEALDRKNWENGQPPASAGTDAA